jgi:hypothetical protein
MSQLNRRNALTAVAALPALAVPSVANAAMGPYPIFAVIEAHRRAWADLGTECTNQEVRQKPASVQAASRLAARCRMKILPEMLMYFVAFGAMIVLLVSLIGMAFWLLIKAWQTVMRQD